MVSHGYDSFTATLWEGYAFGLWSKEPGFQSGTDGE